MSLPAKDLVDVRLSDAFGLGGCPVCAVRARSERSIVAAIIEERVLDIGFRATLERREGFCRRHVRELLVADRRETGGMLGTSILYGAILHRRLELVVAAAAMRGRRRRAAVGLARVRPPCVACAQGDEAVATALARSVERATDPAWAEALATAPFCLDDLLALADVARDDASFAPILRRQIERLTDLEQRLDGFVDHSSHDRLAKMTDVERSAAGEAAQTLGGDPV
jgi:hypothetical protein